MSSSSLNRRHRFGRKALGLGLAAVCGCANAQHLTPQDSAALHRALDSYDAGNLAEAEPLLQTLATKYPSSYQAAEALGSLYAETGELPQALPYLLHATSLAPRASLAHANLGAAYLKLGRPTAALPELQQAARLDPRNAPVQANLAQALFLAGKPSEAAAAYASAASLTPADSALKYNWAVALYTAGTVPAARQAAAILDSIPEDARTDQTHALAADASERAGDFAQALTHFQLAAQLSPSDANLYALDLELLRHWTWTEAIRVANFGQERYPAATHFKVAAGIALYADNNFDESAKAFSSLLEADPDNATFADLLGRSCSLLAEGENVACTKLYDFSQRHPGNAVTSTYAAIAILHRPGPDLDHAAALLRSALTADPKYAEAYFEMGVVEQTRLHWEESAAFLEQAIALSPSSPDAHYRLSRAYAHLGMREQANAQIALHQAYAKQAKDTLNARMQEIMKFVLSPT